MKSFYRLLIWISFGAALPALADVGQSRAGLEKAYGDYYKALRSKPGFTQEDSSRLSKQMIAPAQQALQKAIHEQTRSSLSEAKKRKTKLFHGDLSGTPPKGGAGAQAKQDAGAPAAPRAQPTPETPTRSQTVLDGSKVPRELEFGGPSKKSDTPPAPAPH